MKIKKLLQTSLATLGLIFAFATPTVMVASGESSVVYASTEGEVRNGLNSVGGSQERRSVGQFVKNIINILLFVVGAIAVVMIVIGGLRYVISGGDSNAVNGAKNTVLYSVVGLVVAIMGYAIVNFVLDNVIK